MEKSFLKIYLLLIGIISSVEIQAQCGNLKPPIANDKITCTDPLPHISATAQGSGLLQWFDGANPAVANKIGILQSDCYVHEPKGIYTYYVAEYDSVNKCYGPTKALNLTLFEPTSVQIINDSDSFHQSVYLNTIHTYKIQPIDNQSTYTWRVSGKNQINVYNQNTFCDIIWTDTKIKYDNLILDTIYVITSTNNPIHYSSLLNIFPNPTKDKIFIENDYYLNTSTIEIKYTIGSEF